MPLKHTIANYAKLGLSKDCLIFLNELSKVNGDTNVQRTIERIIRDYQKRLLKAERG
jgi:hypothetical protein